MNPILQVKNINKYFDGAVPFHALKDISFSVNQGEMVSIMGKSGCGKSTLLYILSTMDTQYTGELYIQNQLITGQTPDFLAHIRNQHIGFVFQFHYLLPEFTVLDNVMLPALKLGVKSKEEIEDNALKHLEMLGIKDQALKLSTMISGGQKQRVAIARALINEPTLIMGDEPTGNLDTKNSLLVFDIFKELSQEKKLSLLIVTHDEDFANKCDRKIIMEDGKVIRDLE
jgi:lipoprotein-releasing system ATP-binding protein